MEVLVIKYSTFEWCTHESHEWLDIFSIHTKPFISVIMYVKDTLKTGQRNNLRNFLKMFPRSNYWNVSLKSFKDYWTIPQIQAHFANISWDFRKGYSGTSNHFCSSLAFIWMVTLEDFPHKLKSSNHLVQHANRQHHRTVLLSSWHLNGQTLPLHDSRLSRREGTKVQRPFSCLYL